MVEPPSRTYAAMVAVLLSAGGIALLAALVLSAFQSSLTLPVAMAGGLLVAVGCLFLRMWIVQKAYEGRKDQA